MKKLAALVLAVALSCYVWHARAQGVIGCGPEVAGAAPDGPGNAGGCGPASIPSTTGGGSGGSACANGNLLLDYSDPCQLESQMVGL
jgi:hypothetical protein